MKITLRLLVFSLVSAVSQAASIDQQADALFVRGQAAEQRGNEEIAAICYQLVIRAKPDHQAAQKRILEIGKLSGMFSPTNQVTGKLILPQVSFSGATLDEAIEFLRVKSRDLDPLGRGVDFVILPLASSSSAHITLELINVPLEEAVRYIVELAGMTYRWENGRVLVLPQKMKAMQLPEVQADASTLSVTKWRLPVFSVTGASLAELMDQLKNLSRSADPMSKGLNLAFQDAVGKPASPEALSKAVISLELHEVSVHEVLRFTAALFDASIRVEQDRVVIRPAGQSAPVSSSPASAPISDPAKQIHTWTNQTGVTINAAFVGLDGDAVVIRKDGKEFTIPFSKLNTASQELAMKLSVSQK